MEDQRVESWLDVDYKFVTSYTQAQPLAKISLMTARLGWPLNLALMPDGNTLDTIAGDMITVTDPEAGINNTYRVNKNSIETDLTVALEARHEAASFYDWNPTTEEKDYVPGSDQFVDDQDPSLPGMRLVCSIVGGSNRQLAIRANASNADDLGPVRASGRLRLD